VLIRAGRPLVTTASASMNAGHAVMKTASIGAITRQAHRFLSRASGSQCSHLIRPVRADGWRNDRGQDRHRSFKAFR
jgi:hypothetical protein